MCKEQSCSAVPKPGIIPPDGSKKEIFKILLALKELRGLLAKVEVVPNKRDSSCSCHWPYLKRAIISRGQLASGYDAILHSECIQPWDENPRVFCYPETRPM